MDRSFIAPESEDEKAAIILQSIVSLAHDLGLTIVAEGIEDQAQVDRLVDLQCDYGQGFFIGQPMTAKQVGESLTSMPYVKGHGRTAMSNLWERAAHEPVPFAVETELTASAIENASIPRKTSRASGSGKGSCPGHTGGKNCRESPAARFVTHGAARCANPHLKNCHAFPWLKSKPAKKPKKKPAEKKKLASKKESPKPSGVA